MSACPDHEMLLQGLLDGELDAANTLICEAHLKTCEGCNAQFLRLQALREALGTPGVAHRAPSGLAARIAEAIDNESRPARPRPARRPPAWAGPAIGALAASLVVVVSLPQVADPGPERQLVASHVRSLLANHLMDVVTSNQHVVRPWFNGKVDIAPPVPELAAEGFPLAGGRLDYIEGRVAPAIVYRRHLHTVNLFVWPAKWRLLPRRTVTEMDGYSVVEWTQGGLRFAAVSDIELTDLKQFRDAFIAHSKG